MIYRCPDLDVQLEHKLADLEGLRQQLARQTRTSSLRWVGTLRRHARATAVEGSTAIEGFRVPHDEALSIVAGDADPGNDENRLAVACYARAMEHVGVMAGDPELEWSKRVLLDLHFDACQFQRASDPGRWRTGPVSVVAADGTAAYRAPDAADVPQLMAEVVSWLRDGDVEAPVVVRAAMAHLHMVAAHPFRDGNGRVARIVQSLVLAREGPLAPELTSIEEYLAEHTADYYAALMAVQGGSYRPDRDASGWIDFCVDAHLDQARRRVAQIERAARRWERLEATVAERDWPDRLTIALEQSLLGGVSRASYGREADVSDATASSDLRRLVDGGLIVQVGRGRTSRYAASPQLERTVSDDGA